MNTCPKCGMQNIDGELFCAQCGTRLAEAVPPPTPPVSENPKPAPTPVSTLGNGGGNKKTDIRIILTIVIPIVVLLLLGVLVGGVALVLYSDDSEEFVEETVDSATYEELVYADSYDGFLNIRASASSKGEIIGRFRNGPHGAVKLGEVGNWVEIEYNGIIGYVSKPYVSYYPTKAVTVNVDEKWLMGPWYPSHKEYAYILFNNGTYTVQYEYGTIAYGTYRLEGEHIIFNATMLSNRGYDVGSYEKFRITVSPKRIGPLTKRSLIKEADRWKHYGELVWTWAEYTELKKQTKLNVR